MDSVSQYSNSPVFRSFVNFICQFILAYLYASKCKGFDNINHFEKFEVVNRFKEYQRIASG